MDCYPIQKIVEIKERKKKIQSVAEMNKYNLVIFRGVTKCVLRINLAGNISSSQVK